MKILKFTTPKGDFALMDGKEQIDQTLKALLDEYTPVAKVSEMTEEQFAEVVEMQRIFNPTNPYCIDDIVYKNYTGDEWVWSSKESFESLVKSLGWYLFENPECPNQFCDNGYIDLGYNEKARCSLCEEAEERVFENPILLKKI